jgi:hypothetical protein
VTVNTAIYTELIKEISPECLCHMNRSYAHTIYTVAWDDAAVLDVAYDTLPVQSLVVLNDVCYICTI